MFDETAKAASLQVIQDKLKGAFISLYKYICNVYVIFRCKYISVNISTSCAFFALKLGDMSLLIIFYYHTKLQLDSMSSFGDFRGGNGPPVRLRICKNMVPDDGLRL